MFFYEGYICPVCGKKFQESDDIVACPECGAPLSSTANFCSECGAPAPSAKD